MAAKGYIGRKGALQRETARMAQRIGPMTKSAANKPGRKASFRKQGAR